MTLLETIEQDLKAAMRENNELVKNTLRMVKADLLNEKAKTGKDISEDLALEVAGRAAKKRKEAMLEFEKAGREDLASKEREEITIIERYLPKQLTDAEILSAVDAKIAAVGNISQKDAGRVMGEIMKELKGRADGNVVKKALALRLEGK